MVTGPPDPRARPVTAEVPDLVPARMLNEYAYCPRLFFLEWVDSLWASNADVAEGVRRHRRVDSGGGAAPLPDEGQVLAARSVELASERLGIVAELDLLEGAGGGVIPVDTKKGHPAADGTPWEADAVQVCAQVLLLREHGYTVDRGEIFYAQTRQRVPVEPTPELIARTMEIVTQARTAAVRLAPPPPLESSPKCPRCSLVGICLPDETNVLAHRLKGPPRRLIAADPDAAPLYVTEPGSYVGVEGGRLVISKHRERIASVRLIDVLHVCAFGNVQVSAQALCSLFERDIDVFHFSYGGWLLGLTTRIPVNNKELRGRREPNGGARRLDGGGAQERRGGHPSPAAGAGRRAGRARRRRRPCPGPGARRGPRSAGLRP